MNVQHSLLALTIAAAAVLAACGQKEDTAASSQAASAAELAASSAELAGSAVATAASAAVEGAASAVDSAASATAAAAASAVNAASAAAGAVTGAAAGAGAAAGLDLAKGEALYKSTCQACHAAGVAGAPKLDDKADWGPRIAQGEETLFKHSIEGFTGQKGVMPPKGGSTAPDEDVKAAVMYMVSHGK